MLPTPSNEPFKFSSPHRWQICRKNITDKLPFGPHDYQLEGITDGQDVVAVSAAGSGKSAHIYMLAIVLLELAKDPSLSPSKKNLVNLSLNPYGNFRNTMFATGARGPFDEFLYGEYRIRLVQSSLLSNRNIMASTSWLQVLTRVFNDWIHRDGHHPYIHSKRNPGDPFSDLYMLTRNRSLGKNMSSVTANFVRTLKSAGSDISNALTISRSRQPSPSKQYTFLRWLFLLSILVLVKVKLLLLHLAQPSEYPSKGPRAPVAILIEPTSWCFGNPRWDQSNNQVSVAKNCKT